MKYIIAVAAILLASCETTPEADRTELTEFSSQDQRDIAESVLKSLYGKNASAQQSNKVGASLCIDGKNPSRDFLTRFERLRPPPFPCSASSYNKTLGELVMRGTTKPMISFSVSEIRIVSSSQAVAKGGYYEASLSSAGYTFKLSKINGQWVVEDQRMDWIS